MSECTLIFSYHPTETIGDEGEEKTIPAHYKLQTFINSRSPNRSTDVRTFKTNDSKIDSIKRDLKDMGVVNVNPTPNYTIKIGITSEQRKAINKNYDLGMVSYGGSGRRRPSRKYKKSAKRVFRKKSRSTRRR